MKDDAQKPDGEDHAENRLALGLAFGTPFGVLLSLLTDNWGLLGVGIALGVAFGVMPSKKRGPEQDGNAPDDD